MAPTRFDPNGPADADAGIFGLPFSEDESALVMIPVPWDATTSYRPGAARGPEAVLAASPQLDLYDLELEDPWAPGIHLQPVSAKLARWNKAARKAALPVLEGRAAAKRASAICAEVDALCERMVDRVRGEAARLIAADKTPAVLGGDHSTPLGLVAALGVRHREFGILHLDAHHDLRKAYQGFAHSHASIMRNVMERVPAVTKLVQVGIRDFSQDEHDFARAQPDRIAVHYDRWLAESRARGTPWSEQMKTIVGALPELVYLSFDIDGLDPKLCPNTGTPVPGGLQFDDAAQLVREVVVSGRRIIGFDLVEVAPGAADLADSWDANVAMRLLYRMAAWTLASQGRLRQRAR
jgi:agmatinase